MAYVDNLGHAYNAYNAYDLVEFSAKSRIIFVFVTTESRKIQICVPKRSQNFKCLGSL